MRNDAIQIETFTHKGYKVSINVYLDDNMGAPWEEHDGHGVVSDWETRRKEPGELILAGDGPAYRFYDFKTTLKIAQRDGWGLTEKDKAALQQKLGRPPTKKEVLVESVMRDYRYLKDWCEDRWQWLGYITTIHAPGGGEIGGDSRWGFDDSEYMLKSAKEVAIYNINEDRKKTAKELRASRAQTRDLEQFAAEVNAY